MFVLIPADSPMQNNLYPLYLNLGAKLKKNFRN